MGALGEEDHARTSDVSSLFRTVEVLHIVPPVVIGEVRLAIDRAAAIDVDIMYRETREERAIGRDGLAFPASQRKEVRRILAEALCALERAWDIGKLVAVVAGKNL